MQIGYARVSQGDQNFDLQVDALVAAGCEKIFSDRASGARSDRSGLAEALEFARAGDVIAVWRLDRLGRSLPHLLEVMRNFDARRVGFRSLRESIDTTSAAGRLTAHLFGCLAEFERDLIRERTLAGLAAARMRGRVGGRPAKMNYEKLEAATKLLADGTPARVVADIIGVSVQTLYRWMQSRTEPKAPL